MRESSAMTEIRRIKSELSEKARGMSKRDFLDFIKKEALNVKESIKVNSVSK
jgi:hypothetical protein